MIRQAISCDVCGTEKKQTNHWFVAREQGGELHLSGWGSRNRSRAGSKHLCGQTCLHKLVDEFMARTISARVQPAAAEPVVVSEPPAELIETEAAPRSTDTSLTASGAYLAAEAQPRTFAPPMQRRPPVPAGIGPLAVPSPIQMEAALVPMADEPPTYPRRSWRAEAWEREREREQRGSDRLHEITTGRRS